MLEISSRDSPEIKKNLKYKFTTSTYEYLEIFNLQ